MTLTDFEEANSACVAKTVILINSFISVSMLSFFEICRCPHQHTLGLPAQQNLQRSYENPWKREEATIDYEVPVHALFSVTCDF